ncbi:hypothetical protein OK006_7747 [Actinobacteria bacterium OK006]|nr:hypothetical protein OK006_7747 [Actinobacteria bacterium OK006]
MAVTVSGRRLVASGRIRRSTVTPECAARVANPRESSSRGSVPAASSWTGGSPWRFACNGLSSGSVGEVPAA